MARGSDLSTPTSSRIALFSSHHLRYAFRSRSRQCGRALYLGESLFCSIPHFAFHFALYSSIAQIVTPCMNVLDRRRETPTICALIYLSFVFVYVSTS